ncbi:MAG: outer membrane lipoprotein chaperone LolA, partial [Gammaproteobacteria bacterium]|nr:outer membrane lipoprotein chaperone LolA [Gammaproteobacteria bacterium]
LQKSLGTLELQRPGKFRWEVTKPMRQLIVTDGKTVWIDEPDLQQVTIRSLDIDSQQTPILLLTNHAYLMNKFTISQLSAKASMQRFLLIPTNKQEAFGQIIITFQKDRLNQMEFSNQLDQKTQLIFSDVKMNPALDAKLFVFTLPKGVDVIDQRTT